MMPTIFQFIHKNLQFLLGVRELVTALTAKFISRSYLFQDGINSVIKGGNELPHSKCEFRNSQKMKFEN
jgi:hypothetical protein